MKTIREHDGSIAMIGWGKLRIHLRPVRFWRDTTPYLSLYQSGWISQERITSGPLGLFNRLRDWEYMRYLKRFEGAK